jgi:hypothetical protein
MACLIAFSFAEGRPMATPNYSYEKRQRELAKKRKKEEKAYRKANGLPELTGDESAAEDGAGAGETPAQAEGTAPGAPAA